jgi:hypothetical protein
VLVPGGPVRCLITLASEGKTRGQVARALGVLHPRPGGARWSRSALARIAQRHRGEIAQRRAAHAQEAARASREAEAQRVALEESATQLARAKEALEARIMQAVRSVNATTPLVEEPTPAPTRGPGPVPSWLRAGRVWDR